MKKNLWFVLFLLCLILPSVSFAKFLTKEEVVQEYSLVNSGIKTLIFAEHKNYKKNLASLVKEKDLKPTTNNFKYNFNQFTITEIPDSKDLRYRDTPIKSQIGSLCTAYSGVALMENIINRNGVKTGLDLSELHAFSFYKVYQMDKFVSTITKNKICDNQYFYKSSRYVPVACKDNAHATLTSVRQITQKEVEQALANDNPVYFGLGVPRGMANCQKVITDEKVTSGGHAVAVVGYYKNKEDTFYIIKNSWGSDCGDSGYQILNANYCKKTWCYFYEFSSVASRYDNTTRTISN